MDPDWQGRRQGGAKGAAPPPPLTKKKKRERGERKRERKKKEKRGIKREGKLNQSFQKHVVMGLSGPQTLGGPQTPDRNVVGIPRLASAPPSAKPCLRPC